MPLWNHSIAKLITVRYWIAIGVIALAVTASYVILSRSIETQRHLFRIVGFAAEQSRSSQRAAFLANAYVHAADPEMRQIYKSDLRKTAARMAGRHQILSLRAKPERIPKGMRSILQNVYYGAPNPFDAQVQSFLGSLRAVMIAKESDLRADMPDLLRINFGALTSIKQTHELVFRLLEREANAAVNRLRLLDTALWLFTLAVLAIEIPVIFRPMARRAAKSLERTETARQNAEREAAAAEAAREGQASFIRTMSHELRTPLNAILGMAELQRLAGLPPKQEEYAQDIQKAGQHLLDLINGILEFSRLEAKQVKIEKTEISLGEELEQTISYFGPLAAEKALNFSYRIDPKLSGSYLADGMRIQQILANMIDNAIKFTKEGSVSIRAIHAGRVGRSDDLVRFEVEDTGIGVAPDLHKRIFEEFQQADYSLARKFGGPGLGLAICSRLVRLMNGEIGVESAGGKGSLFWFTLPLERAGSPVSPSANPEKGGRMAAGG